MTTGHTSVPAMTEISERYRRNAERFAETIRAVPADRWSSPSPCEGWTAADLVQHVIDSPALFLGLVQRAPIEVPSVEQDPLGAFLGRSAQVLADLEDPQLASETFEGFLGTTRFDEAIDRFVTFDLIVHRWDLARATGGDETIEPDEAERLLTVDIPAFGEMLHSPGVCAAPVDVAPDASTAHRVLALLGRTP